MDETLVKVTGRGQSSKSRRRSITATLELELKFYIFLSFLIPYIPFIDIPFDN